MIFPRTAIRTLFLVSMRHNQERERCIDGKIHQRMDPLRESNDIDQSHRASSPASPPKRLQTSKNRQRPSKTWVGESYQDNNLECGGS